MVNINFYKKFISYGFDDNIVSFQNFYKTKPNEFEESLSILKEGLDTESIYNIDSFLNVILSLPLPSKNFLVKKSAIYSQKEQEEIIKEEKFAQNINKYYKKYKLQGFEKIEYAVFNKHYGLKDFSKEVIESLYNKIFIDIGAFWGDSALMLNNYNPQKIISFEPNTINYNLLQKTINNNNLQNKIILENIALGEKKEIKALNFISKYQNQGSSFLYKAKKAKQEEVQINLLDDYIKDNHIDYKDISLIKIDAEGYGRKCILGARNTIAKSKPIILCGIYHNAEEFFQIRPLLQDINKDYKFKFICLSQRFILKEMTLIAY